MGASASIVSEGTVPDEFQLMLETVDRQKFKIAEADSLVLNRESTKVFKKHTKIIECLTSRTKHQLKKMYGGSKSNPEDIYKLIGKSLFQLILAAFLAHTYKLHALNLIYRNQRLLC